MNHDDLIAAHEPGRQRNPATDHPDLHTGVVRGEIARGHLNAVHLTRATMDHHEPLPAWRGEQLCTAVVQLESWWRDAMREIATLRAELETRR